MDTTRTRSRLGIVLPLVLGLGVASAFAGWAWGRLDPGGPPATFSVAAGTAEGLMRRTEVAFADAESVWERGMRAVSQRAYDKADVTFFSRSTPTPCAGGDRVSAPFYCPETGTAAFDLVFLDGLGVRLKRQRDLGLAIYTARVAAEHLQRELGVLDRAALELVGSKRSERRAIGTALALQADCLAGAWAAAAAPRIGPVPDDLYGQMVWSSRNLVTDMARAGERVSARFDVLGTAPEADRAAAFARGYAVGALAACIGPGAG